jgi:hypothetical protein
MRDRIVVWVTGVNAYDEADLDNWLQKEGQLAQHRDVGCFAFLHAIICMT